VETARKNGAEKSHRIHLREEYAPPAYGIETVELTFHLDDETTRVVSRLTVKRLAKERVPLVLDAGAISVISLSLDGTPLSASEWFLEGEKLVVHSVPEAFVLEAETEISPAENTALEGLYLSHGILCTQCESEGFRRITCYPDRPDVTAVFTTKIVADRGKYPVLLSNGNLVESGDLPGGRHYAVWHDPFRKPAYLFALVAGNLKPAVDSFVTCSGRNVRLEIWVEEKDLHRTGHAMECLKDAMRWDEEKFGREYDLDVYMIVAVDHFNAGAMENKGLNIFNSNMLFADTETATDDDYHAISRVIAHEYFHNWTGNRVTLQDWFQLSLKEGLTIFRDEEFSADNGSRAVRRIADVRLLRATQFPEDAGPLAHPVRPDSFVDISNFYTMTVYRKGAEVVRMLRTILGEESFRAGMDLYFRRHDGTGATIDDFVKAMADASGADLSHFMLWYGQAGTPLLKVRGRWDAATKSFTLHVRQETPPTPGQPAKKPLHLPLAVGLVDGDGKPLPLLLEGEDALPAGTKVLELRRKDETFRFRDVDRKPVPSLLRSFSAPVRLDYPYREEELLLLMAHDPDPFSRWEAAQRLACDLILKLADDPGRRVSGFVAACGSVLKNTADRAFAAEVLTLPTEKYLAELVSVVDPERLHAARELLRLRICESLGELLASTYDALQPDRPFDPNDLRQGDRKLRNLVLWYMTAGDAPEAVATALGQFREADNMTGRMGGLAALNNCEGPERETALAEMYGRWRDNRQVVDKWLALQALSTLPGTPDRVQELMDHPAFDLKNPNRVRALVGTFCSENQLRFHESGGSGYRFLGDQVLRLDPVNPQLAAKLLPPLTRWEKYDVGRQGLMKGELERILATRGLSKEVFDVTQRGLRPTEPAAKRTERVREQPKPGVQTA
jgi:aminopeptidase N